MSKDISSSETIGTGAYFPIHLTEVNGKTSWKMISGDVRLINHNLISIFNTQIGELIRNEDFGTRLWECLEEPNTQALEFMVRKFCKNAIETYEKRIEFIDSNTIRHQDKLYIKLYYRVIGGNIKTGQGQLEFSYNLTNNTIQV